MNKELKTSELGEKILRNIHIGMEKGLLNNDDLLQFIEDAGMYLNLMTLPAYAKYRGISYNAAKSNKNKVQLFGVKFIAEND